MKVGQNCKVTYFLYYYAHIFRKTFYILLETNILYRKRRGEFSMKIQIGVILISLLIVGPLWLEIASSTEPQLNDSKNYGNNVNSLTAKSTQAIVTTFNNYQKYGENAIAISSSSKEKSNMVILPASTHTGEIFGWWIRLVYNGQTFEKKLDISITDFSDKFLKHPEYGERIKFNIDSDPEDDVEVIVGFYWAVIGDVNTNKDLTSLETRVRVRQLPKTGSSGLGGIEDINGNLEVWSELHVNLGLIKNKGKGKSLTNSPFQLVINLLEKILNNKKSSIFFTNLKNIIDKIIQNNNINKEISTSTLSSSNDYFSIGAGYRSPEGQKIPMLMEKKFSFAKDINWNPLSIFNPTIFQHKTDPGGEEPIELLYGFQSYKEGEVTPTYDIAFSVEFEPAVYVETKFVPTGGYVYYYFDQKSQKSSQTKVTFSSNIIKGDGENVPGLSLIFDKIDSYLASRGRWMCFDLDLKGFQYKASHEFDIGLEVSVPDAFEEKVELKQIPKMVDFEWGLDLDLNLLPNIFDVTFGGYLELDMSSKLGEVTIYYPKTGTESPESPFLKVKDIPSYQKLSAESSLSMVNGSLLKVDVGGYVDLTMSSELNRVTMYYPKASDTDPEIVFIDIPEGIPSKTRIGADARLYVDIDNLQNPSNNVYGRIYHDCSSNLDEIQMFLPGLEIPVVEITDIPADSSAEAGVHWNQLQGFGHASRGYIGGIDPINLYLEYGGITLSNTLEIREGYISTNFKIGESGYFYFDTSRKMFANTFSFESLDTGDALALTVDEVSADRLKANWDIDTSGEDLKINELTFGGIVDTITNLHFDLDYKGKVASLDLDWALGDDGKVLVDFAQDEPIRLDFDMSNDTSNYDLRGFVELPANPHFDMDWKWWQGESATDPGYFKINEHTTQKSIEDINLYFTYQDTWGAEVNLADAGIYVSVDWYWYNLFLYIWPVIDIYGDLDLHLLLDGDWYYNVEDWINP